MKLLLVLSSWLLAATVAEEYECSLATGRESTQSESPGTDNTRLDLGSGAGTGSMQIGPCIETGIIKIAKSESIITPGEASGSRQTITLEGRSTSGRPLYIDPSTTDPLPHTGVTRAPSMVPLGCGPDCVGKIGHVPTLGSNSGGKTGNLNL